MKFSIKKEGEAFAMAKIDKVELHEFQFEANNLGLSANTNSIGGLSFEKGAKPPSQNMLSKSSLKTVAEEAMY